MTRTQAESILVLQALAEEREIVAGVLRRAGHGVRVAATAHEALAAREEQAAVVVTDRELPDMDALALIAELRRGNADVVVIVLCDRAVVADTVALMKGGAFHVLEKPVLPEELGVVALKALEHGRLSRGNRDLKNQLDISEKLAMIGRLASGVAHELNNPLDGVRRYVRMTQEGLETEKRELSDYLDRAMSGLSRMASIVRQLLTFSRNVVIENEAENLRTMLDEVTRTLAPGGSASPTVRLENPYLDIRVPRALFQVFVNLLRNALDAVEPLGARGLVRIDVERRPDGIEVVVADNGVGIETDDMRRVFEPFFTTKEVGRGTGLGLPISARIVERCGGTIRIESEKGAGTRVHVVLPVTAATRTGTRTLQEAER